MILINEFPVTKAEAVEYRTPVLCTKIVVLSDLKDDNHLKANCLVIS